MIANDRGIALVITLLVVALLTITVVEFTYSVEVDQRMARNAVNSLQASLLARSGINLGEALLLKDDDPLVDSFSEEWCPQIGPEGQSCRIDEASSQMVIPENMRLRVEIFDEGGKVNINLTKPQNLQTLTAWQNARDKGLPTSAIFASWLGVLKALVPAGGADPDQVETGIMSYWEAVLAQTAQTPAIAGQVPTPTAADPAAAQTPNPQQTLTDFPSLDDAGGIPGLTPSAIRRLRTTLTAGPANLLKAINVNTARREVLNAVVGPDGAEAVDNVISTRQEQPLKLADLAPLFASIKPDPNDPSRARNVHAMLGVTSTYFLIRASAIINPNPVTGRGGVSRSASMLVLRQRRPGVPPNAPAGTPRWTLTRLDWQKEGGAALFQQADQGGGQDSSAAGMAEQGGQQ